ncbi:MAG: NAD(P)-binding domain-containing protein [Sandaracinus sp.]|nr:NAD(P)-binding domain-containing protein [Sandaracinus sp.]MCB9620081.1 NAD(P)-binding domain-containing protein [Sandaracinus sp.]MCB9625156.1 NAD(P)-binding domain-containing protein [Sandaracinus sp.]
MKIAIVGVGNVGAALGARFSEAGHEVLFGVRATTDAYAARFGARVRPVSQAARDAEVVVLAVPGSVAVEAAGALGLREGQVLVDCTNPIRWSEGPVWAPPPEGSNASALAAAFPNVDVVKAFNQFGAETHADPAYGDRRADVFLASDSDEAKAKVSVLATSAGFEAVDAGKLRNAAVLENVAVLWIHLATVGGLGRAFVLARLSR